MGETPWLPIATEDDWRRLDVLANGFHDGVIKEMHWSHGEFVDQSLHMVYGCSPTLWLLVQIQNRGHPAVELRFRGVRQCIIRSEDDVEAVVTILPDEVVFSLSFHGGSRIVAASCEYRLAGEELLGPGPFPAPAENECVA